MSTPLSTPAARIRSQVLRGLVRRCFVASLMISSLSSGVASAAANEGTQNTAQSNFDQLLLRAYSDDAEAQFYVGVTLAEGIDVPQDFPQAVQWYIRAAENGHAPAQYNLADSYLRGLGVTKDIRQSVFWWRKAAEQGYVLAQTNLGRAYYLGIGTPRNLERARYWLSQALEQGDAKARTMLAKLNRHTEQFTGTSIYPAVRDGMVVWVFDEYVQDNGNSAKIIGNNVRGRSQPGTSREAKVLGTFQSNQDVIVLRRAGGWVQVSATTAQQQRRDESKNNMDLVGLPNTSVVTAKIVLPDASTAIKGGSESTEGGSDPVMDEKAPPAAMVKEVEPDASPAQSDNPGFEAEYQAPASIQVTRLIDPVIVPDEVFEQEESAATEVDVNDNKEPPQQIAVIDDTNSTQPQPSVDVETERPLAVDVETQTQDIELTQGTESEPQSIVNVEVENAETPATDRAKDIENVAQTSVAKVESAIAVSAARAAVVKESEIETKVAMTFAKQVVPDSTAAIKTGKTPQLVNDNAWLYAQSTDHYTIQLISVNTETEATSYVTQYELKEAAYFATRTDKVDWYYILNGSYPTRSAALEAAGKLPVESVWIRNIGKLQASRCRKSARLPKSFTGELESHCSATSPD